MAELIVVYWRDIPAQVIVRRGRTAAKRQLSERFGQCNGGIGGNGPRSLETLLIHHDRYRLAPPVCRQCLLLWLGSGGPSGPGEAI